MLFLRTALDLTESMKLSGMPDCQLKKWHLPTGVAPWGAISCGISGVGSLGGALVTPPLSSFSLASHGVRPSLLCRAHACKARPPNFWVVVAFSVS